MQFLNDKFFRVAVILFFFLMALPFMFSTPEPEKKDNTPVLEFEDKNPVYKIIDRIARFYGFNKKNNDKDFTLNNEQISQIKKQIAEKKEKQIEQSIKEKITEKIEQNNSATEQNPSQKDSASKQTSANPINTNEYQKTNTYVKLDNEIYEVLKDKDNKKYLSNGSTLIAMDSLPKSVRRNLKPIPLQNFQNSYSKNIKAPVYIDNTTNLAPQNYLKENQNTQVVASSFNTAEKSSSPKGSIGSFFKPTTKAGQDFIESIDSNIKNIKFIKQNKDDQTHTNTPPSYTRTYKAQTVNPKTKKTQTVSVQQQVTPENVKTAEQIRKITIDNIAKQGYNENFFTYQGTEISFPQAEDIASFPAQVPPHVIIRELADSEDLNNSFSATQAKAEQQLPNNPDNFPSLQFVYRNNRDRIIRAPNNSFNVQAISRVLANKVLLPEQSDIDFLDTKGCIYVVPEQQLYKEYTSMQIPVIYYPELSPSNLDQAYNTAQEAIDTLISNKESQSQTEQSQNKAEIENLLTTQE